MKNTIIESSKYPAVVLVSLGKKAKKLSIKPSHPVG